MELETRNYIETRNSFNIPCKTLFRKSAKHMDPVTFLGSQFTGGIK